MESAGGSADQLKDKASEAFEKVLDTSSHAFHKIRTHSALAIEELQRNAPFYKQKLSELVDKIKASDAFQLRAAENVVTVSAYSAQHQGIVRTMANLPVPAMAATTYLAMHIIASLNSLTDLAVGKLLSERTAIASLLALFAVVPAYALSFHYEQQLSQEAGMAITEWSTEVWMVNLRRLPTMFYVLAAANCAVTTKAIAAVGERVIKRLLHLRMKTLLFLGALYWVARIKGVRPVLKTLEAKLPPPAAAALSQGVKSVEEAFANFANKAMPLVGQLTDKLALRLQKTSDEEDDEFHEMAN